jgi:hypothetical protein
MPALKVYLMDPRDPTAAPVCVAPRQEGIEYFVEHCAALSDGSAAGSPAAAGSSAGGSAAVSGSDGSGSRSPTLLLLTNRGSNAGEMRLMSAAAGAPPGYAHAALHAKPAAPRVPACPQLCYRHATCVDTLRRSPSAAPRKPAGQVHPAGHLPAAKGSKVYSPCLQLLAPAA